MTGQRLTAEELGALRDRRLGDGYSYDEAVDDGAALFSHIEAVTETLETLWNWIDDAGLLMPNGNMAWLDVPNDLEKAVVGVLDRRGNSKRQLRD